MKIFESHTHLDNPKFAQDRQQVIANCHNAGIERMINVSCDAQTMADSIALAEKYDFIYATAGFHPHDATELDLEMVRKAAAHPKVVAIGEIGLDYFRDISPRNIQRDAFRQQLELAIKLKMPIIIHDRDAHEDVLSILSEYNPLKVVFHCFAGDYFMAQRIIAAGWHISFTGNITYKNSKLTDIIRMVPADKYFIETDSPYLTPHPHRGKRNDPTMLRYIIEEIAQIRYQSPIMIAQQTFNNASDFFNI
ncbi:MAG: TatD family hydrolase [Candidatus Cloacimonetes bacterium]|nr:TatD family hydrolase [Candidatus Cloacimonadota bacterium]